MDPEANIRPLAVKRSTAARVLDCSITTIHRLIKDGKLVVVKVRDDNRITMESIERLIRG